LTHARREGFVPAPLGRPGSRYRVATKVFKIQLMEAAMCARGGLLCMLMAFIFLSLLGSPARSDSVYIPNGSFESPAVPNAPPYASPNISDWQRLPVPTWWTSYGYTDDAWTQSSGIFVNVPFAPIDDCDGNQLAFMFSVPGYALYQDLAATYQVGQSYHLTVSMQGGGYGMPLGCPMDLVLYYRDANGNQIIIGGTEVTNTNDTGTLSHLTDYTLNVPAVTASDPWAGRSIGVELLQTAGANNSGGYWDIDNVRLSSATAPEPGSLALLAIGLGVLGVRQWRSKKR
jgi:hypothetical protein